MQEKFSLLSNQWIKELSSTIDYLNQNYDEITVLSEATLKNLYERTFGPNTYERVSQITDGTSCITLTYDEAYQGYITQGESGCGGVSAFMVYEKIISATKYSDRIEIVSSAFYIDGETRQIYKDYNKTTSLGGLLVDENTVTDEEERENVYSTYIEENKDNLEQYTYTYMLNEDGFYYLIGVERTNA